MEYQGNSLIVECQFLLRFMLEAKRSIHQLYEITRNYEFVNDMSKIISIAQDKQEQLYFLVHSSSNDISILAQFLMSYVDEVDLGLFDANGMNVFHYACQLGNVKLFKLLLNVTNKTEWKKYLNMPANLPV